MLFVPVPYIQSIALSGAGLSCTILRSAADASCRPAVPPQSVLGATVTFDSMPIDSGATVLLTDGCGGTSVASAVDLVGGTASFTWTAPAAAGTCILTATATRDTLADHEDVAVALQ